MKIARLTIILAWLSIAGCAPLHLVDPSRMTPEQIKAWASDKNASVSCGRVNTLYGPTTLIYWNLDKGLIFEGQLIVKPDCETSYTNDSRKVRP